MLSLRKDHIIISRVYVCENLPFQVAIAGFSSGRFLHFWWPLAPWPLLRSSPGPFYHYHGQKPKVYECSNVFKISFTLYS